MKSVDVENAKWTRTKSIWTRRYSPTPSTTHSPICNRYYITFCILGWENLNFLPSHIVHFSTLTRFKRSLQKVDFAVTLQYGKIVYLIYVLLFHVCTFLLMLYVNVYWDSCQCLAVLLENFSYCICICFYCSLLIFKQLNDWLVGWLVDGSPTLPL